MPCFSGIDSDQAQAQTFIERILKQDAQKAKQHRKRPAVKRSQKKPASKQQTATQSESAPAKAETKPAPMIPVPTPAPRPENTATKGAEPETPPIPTEKPEAEPENQPLAKPAPTTPTQAAPPKPADNPKPMDEKLQETKPAPDQQPKPEKDERVYQVSCPALIAGEVEGKLLPPIKDGEQCGAHSPLSLTAIGKDNPLKFANVVTTNCAMAVTLAQWSSEVTKAAKDVYGPDSKIAEIGTGSDYQCRKVNGASVGRVSEHAFANALDIMSFKFSDGSKTELESGWNGTDKEKAFWRAVHSASCKLFMTVIGPDGDAAHRTNMHLDQGCHGKSCLARICQ
ncbi:extensin family protein [Brucella anthropi]|uniref:extensin-like domain-containing protein n=1 Tax=Brucella anthropi TaxID=529 RepID=UPI00267414A2|nr:extensin family protein [Brucella anthropi]WKT95882.1 extensin family protein [Brucella anthropi]